ncbi:MAG: SAM-dependent chlorinase/fluorinase [candidate division NC10 bacterium]|nr:SAM-dependent chlorinase/fluorinase [candidate division NC10 bacterium]
MADRPIITLLTDFGTADAFVGVMKGVILGIAPQARLVDLTHEVPPQAVAVAAFLLETAWREFPPGTIHLVVVDPGVGSNRRPLAAEGPRARFVAPDNGVLSPILQAGGATVLHALTRPEFFRQPVSRTFHGRDVFAPVAAHLANGVALAALGPPVTNPVRLDLPRPEPLPGGGAAGQVLHVDRFGNLITNLPEALFAAERGVPVVTVAGHRIQGLADSYAAVPTGRPGAIVGSTGTLEVFLPGGSAAAALGVRRGAAVTVSFAPE